MSGPLGALPGMTFDPTRNRYFPIPKLTPLRTSKEDGILMPTPCLEGRKQDRKRLNLDGFDGEEAGGSRRQVRPQGKHFVRMAGWADQNRRNDQKPVCVVVASSDTQVLRLPWRADYIHAGEFDLETIGIAADRSQSYAGGAYYATTDHGKVISHRASGEAHLISICAESLVGMHTDIPRMTMMAIAAGPEPHIHHFRRDPEMLEHIFMQHSELHLPEGDIFCMGSGDGVCSLGGSKSLTTISYTQGLSTSLRKLPSDALSIHHFTPDLVFVGLRSSSILLEDLRVNPTPRNVVASMRRGKAVVGVRRLRDSASPWGLVASAMGDELLLFDVRFGKSPLRHFEGHINNFQSSLGFATCPDDEILFAAGSDCRIRAWSTGTAERLVPDEAAEIRKTLGRQEENPLRKLFERRVQSIEVTDDPGLDVTVGGEVQRFGRDT